MKQYKDLCRHVLENGEKKETVRERVRSARSATKCGLTFRKVSRCLRRKSSILSPSRMSRFGF